MFINYANTALSEILVLLSSLAPNPLRHPNILWLLVTQQPLLLGLAEIMVKVTQIMKMVPDTSFSIYFFIINLNHNSLLLLHSYTAATVTQRATVSIHPVAILILCY